MRLPGKRLLITGAGHGLGKAIARRTAAARAEVVVTDLDPARVSQTVKELTEANAVAVGYTLDVTSAQQVAAVRDRLHAERGPIDVLVNNAGVVFGGEFLNVPLQRHQTTVAVNLTGLLNVTHAFLPDLIARPEGWLVNVVSASAFVPLPWAASYAASKWAALGFSESLREELRLQGHRHVGVIAVCPSYVATGMFDGVRPPRLTRMLDPEWVAAAVIRAVERGRERVILPRSVRLLVALAGVLPGSLYRRLCRWLGVTSSMVPWKGHGGPG